MQDVRQIGPLTTISDCLSRLPSVHLIHIAPHPSAQNSQLADVSTSNACDRLKLRALSEKVYMETGTLVLFREAELLDPN